MRTSRRTFAKGVVAAGILTVIPTLPGSRAWATAPPCYEFITAPGTHVRVGAGERFAVTVLDDQQAVLERFDDLDAWDVLALESEHFTVRRIEPPTPAAA